MTTYTGGFTTPGTSAEINLVLEVNVTSQSIPNNQSTLSWNFYMQEYVNANPFHNTANCAANATVGSLVYSAGNLTYNFDGTNETIGIASGSTVITHNADGTKAITISAAYDGLNPIGTASINTTLTLPTIPRNRMRVGVSGVWRTCEVYVGVNGAWVMAQPYAGVSGAWKQNNSN